MATLEQLPPEGGGGGGPQGGAGGGATSYAGRVAGKQVNGRKKLNVLDIMLERRDNQVSYNMSKEELSKLLIRKMKIEPKNILKIDTSGFGKVHIELADKVNPESFVDLPAFDIHDGLRVKYYKPHHRKEKLVTVNWLDLETPDELLVHVFNHFGKVKSNVKWSRIKQEEGDSALAKLLDNIMNGERQFWMEITKPLPSYAVIDNRKVKIYHAGQRRTCARCQKVADLCKGNSNAKLCDDNGGDKINVIDAWKVTLTSVNYTEWNSEELVNVKEVIENDEEGNNSAENPADVTNCDGFVISNLDEETTIDDIKTMLKGAATDDAISGITVHPTGSLRSKIVKDIDPALVTAITKTIDSKSYRGRLIHCRPHVPVTPPKQEAAVEQVEPVQKEAKEEESKKTETVAKEAAVNTSMAKPNPSKDEDLPKTEIPGLSKKEVDRAKKKQADKLKKEEKKKGKNKAEEKKPKDLKLNDFLMNSPSKDEKPNEFVFSSLTDSDDSDTFNDSKEEIDTAFSTPLTLKSSFARSVARSESRSRSRSASVKRNCSSPDADNENLNKKKNMKSSLPTFRKNSEVKQ